jgi:site-specific DNA recombinase
VLVPEASLHLRHEDHLDEYTQRTIVAWLSRRDVFEALTAADGDDADVAAARSEAQRLRAELEQWRKLAETGEVTAISFAPAEKGCPPR